MSEVNKQTLVSGVVEEKVTWRRREALFGLISWWEEVRVESFGNDIYIATDHPISNIYFNGKKIMASQRDSSSE